MTQPTYLPSHIREACHKLSDAISAPYGKNKTPDDWTKFFVGYRSTDLSTDGTNWTATVYEDNTQETVLATATAATAEAALFACLTTILPNAGYTLREE